MFFVITAIAAIISTAIWYINAPEDKYKFSLLSFIFWGATLMWLVDHVMAYFMEGGGEFIEISLDAMLLGVSVVFLGLLAWMIVLLVTDPKGVFEKVLKG
ncbi:MAG: hypothetical protein ACOX3N_06240 [Dethiobacteria bacterium]|jgi:hypothetical protein